MANVTMDLVSSIARGALELAEQAKHLKNFLSEAFEEGRRQGKLEADIATVVEARKAERAEIVALIKSFSGVRADDNSCDEIVRAIGQGEHSKAPAEVAPSGPSSPLKAPAK